MTNTIYILTKCNQNRFRRLLKKIMFYLKVLSAIAVLSCIEKVGGGGESSVIAKI